MPTIDDRAIAWSEQHRDIYMCNADVIAELSYKQGAIEQKAIDDEEYRKDMTYVNIKKQELIDKSCTEVEDLLYRAKRLGIHSIPQLVEKFRKAMEQ